MPPHVRLPRAVIKLAPIVLSSLLLLVFVARTDVVSFQLPFLLPESSSSNSPAVVLLPPPADSEGKEDMAAAAVDLRWYAPTQTPLNDLAQVVSANTTGVYGFVYNSSQVPDAAYGVYNWCNMPHVRASEYVRPPDEYDLVYVELMHRHHKRTPYAANAFPVESYSWDCADQGLFYYAEPFSSAAGSSSKKPNDDRNASAAAYWVGTSDVAGFTNPFAPTAKGFKGSCQFPQITAGGLDDSWQHGVDLYETYGDLLGFLPYRSKDDDGRELLGRSADHGKSKHHGNSKHHSKTRRRWRDHVRYRVTNNVITSEVAGLVINGMWRTTNPVPLLIQPSGVDGLEPSYSCSSSTKGFKNIKSIANTAWADHLNLTAGLYAELDGISGVPPDDEGFHVSFDHYYDNLSARQCHGKPLPCKLVNGTDGGMANDTSNCVSQDMADAVYRLGLWEYSQIYRDAGAETLAASVGSLGVWIAELSAHLKAAVDGSSDVIWFHNVSHDGAVARLLSILQVDGMIWPGMGTEVLFELWRKDGEGESASGHYVRVLFGGRVLTSSHPSLGKMDLVPVETLLEYFDGLTGINASLVVGKCSTK